MADKMCCIDKLANHGDQLVKDEGFVINIL